MYEQITKASRNKTQKIKTQNKKLSAKSEWVIQLKDHFIMCKFEYGALKYNLHICGQVNILLPAIKHGFARGAKCFPTIEKLKVIKLDRFY